MYTRDVAMTTKKLVAFPAAALSGTAGQNNGAILDIKGLGGRALLMVTAGAAGSGNTAAVNIQNSDQSDMSGTPDTVMFFTPGSDVGITAGTAVSNAALAQNFSVNLDGLKRYLRVRILTTGTSVLGSAAAVLVADAGHNVYAGGDI